MSVFRVMLDTLPPAGSLIDLPADQAHHLARVRRLAIGDRIECMDRAGAKAGAVVERIAATTVSIRVAAVEPARTGSQSSITVLPALLPEAKLDLVLQKCTETGVQSCCPVLCERSIVKEYGKALERKLARWRRICDEAARQCGGPPMQVSPPVPLAEALAGAADLKIIADAGGCALEDAARGLPACRAAAARVLIGPEGGFTEDEIERAEAAGWTRVRFHRNTLRAETAAIVCCALVQHFLDTRA
ncbi:16S rRNA (uracil(1498)-N(3))-methyltransferase [bacterium]|nr:16S rRNA (uracil(1498)-N(3))-methyltransferase [bacterium]